MGLFDDVIIYATLMTANLQVMPYFLVGGCLYLWRNMVPRSSVAAILALIAGSYISQLGWQVETLRIFITSYSVITLGSMSTPFIREIGRFGDISYGVYLYGFPVAQTLSFTFGREISFEAHIFWTMLVSYVLALLSWHLVEKKALRLKPRSHTTNAAKVQFSSR